MVQCECVGAVLLVQVAAVQSAVAGSTVHIESNGHSNPQIDILRRNNMYSGNADSTARHRVSGNIHMSVVAATLIDHHRVCIDSIVSVSMTDCHWNSNVPY